MPARENVVRHVFLTLVLIGRGGVAVRVFGDLGDGNRRQVPRVGVGRAPRAAEHVAEVDDVERNLELAAAHGSEVEVLSEVQVEVVLERRLELVALGELAAGVAQVLIALDPCFHILLLGSYVDNFSFVILKL